MIRPARPDELAELSALALRSKAVWGYSAEFLEACRDELTLVAEEIDEVFVKDGGDKPLGFYSLQKESEDRVELGYLFVDPEEVGRGHGAELMRDAIKRARKAGYRILVIQGDPHADGFYRALGAVKVGQRESDSVAGRMLPLYELSL